MATSEEYRALGESAWSWVLDQVCGDDGPWLPEVVEEDDRQTVPAPDRDSLYAGIAGLVPAHGPGAGRARRGGGRLDGR